MKILIVASTFPTSDTDPVPAFVKDQAIALKRRYPTVHISVLAPHDARSKTHNFVKHTYYDEYRFHYLLPHSLEKLTGRGILPQLKKNPLYYLAIPFLFLAEFFSLLRLTRKIQPDFIYAHWFTPQGVVSGMVSSITKIPYVITTHAADVAVWKKMPFGGKIVRRYSRAASAITAVSPRTLEKLRYFFTDAQWRQVEHKVAIIPMGVHLQKSKLPSRRAETSQDILFIGRLAEKKGVQYLLPAFASITEQFPTTTLTIAGDGPLLKELKKQAKALNIPAEHISFSGHVSGKQKEDLLQKAGVYVIPSIITDSGDAEGLPVTLMEGLAAGKICIATNESGADNILENGKSGFLVPQKNVTSLKEALVSALSLPQKERTTMQHNARVAATRFDWSKIAQEHYDFFKDAVKVLK